MMVDRGYRDSRINRIFEGTNEINRMLVVDNALKKGAKGLLPIMEDAEKAFEEIKNLKESKTGDLEYYEEKGKYIANFKKIVLMILKASSDKFGRKIFLEQEILANIADSIMQMYAAESVMLRVQKLESLKSEDEMKVYRDIMDVFVFDVASRIAKSVRDATYSFAFGEVRDLLEKGVEHFTSVEGVNVKEGRRRIADTMIDENRYCF